MITPEEKTTVEIKNGHCEFTGAKVQEGEFQESPVKTVSFNADLKSIGANAFKNSELTGVTFNNKISLDELGAFSFSGTEKLKKVSLPPLVTISEFAFQRSGLESIDFPDNLEVIEIMSFVSSGLKKLSFPSNSKLKSIGVSAFEECKALTTVILPASLEAIHDDAFTGCTNLAYVVIDSDNPEDFKKIKKLLPENLQNKLISKEQYDLLKGFQMAAFIPDPNKSFEEQNELFRFFSPKAPEHKDEMGVLGEPQLLKEIIDYLTPK